MNEIQLQAIIGEGEFGTVYKGTYNGVCPNKNAYFYFYPLSDSFLIFII